MGKKVREVEGLLETHFKAKKLEGLMGRVGDVRKGSLWVWPCGEGFGEVCMLVRNSSGPGHAWLLIGLMSGAVVQSGNSAVDALAGFQVLGPGGKVTLTVVEMEE